MPPNACKVLPAHYALTAPKLQSRSNNGTAFLTFADGNVARFALNWAWLLQQLGLNSLVGISGHLDELVDARFRANGAGVFCADGPLMAANGQAGRWAELLPVLRLARDLRISVLLSDADIAWMRDPLPYFAAVRAAHERVDLLMMTDRAFNNYETSPLGVQPGLPTSAAPSTMTRARAAATRRGGGGGGAKLGGGLGFELELEPGFESAISYNIGVILFCAHALEKLEAMVERFVISIGGGAALAARIGSPATRDSTREKAKSRRGGGAPLRPGALAAWDQEPINKQVLQVQLRHDDVDRRLVRVDGGRLVMGVLPMLQFTTSFTYFMHKKRREMIGAAPPYCLHAIFAHGKDVHRKIGIFREERLWRDPPECATLPHPRCSPRLPRAPRLPRRLPASPNVRSRACAESAAESATLSAACCARAGTMRAASSQWRRCSRLRCAPPVAST